MNPRARCRSGGVLADFEAAVPHVSPNNNVARIAFALFWLRRQFDYIRFRVCGAGLSLQCFAFGLFEPNIFNTSSLQNGVAWSSIVSLGAKFEAVITPQLDVAGGAAS